MLLSEENKKNILDNIFEYIDQNCIFKCNPDEKYSAYEEKGILHNNNNLSFRFYLKKLMYNPKMLYYISAVFLDDIIKNVNGDKIGRAHV